jgi:hypothetical protein
MGSGGNCSLGPFFYHFVGLTDMMEIVEKYSVSGYWLSCIIPALKIVQIKPYHVHKPTL